MSYGGYFFAILIFHTMVARGLSVFIKYFQVTLSK